MTASHNCVKIHDQFLKEMSNSFQDEYDGSPENSSAAVWQWLLAASAQSSLVLGFRYVQLIPPVNLGNNPIPVFSHLVAEIRRCNQELHLHVIEPLEAGVN